MSMKDYGSDTFGILNAEGYDQEHDPGTTEESTAFIAELCSGKKTLELAIGTGRIALGLHKLGIEVHGIDASPEMVASLRAKPGGKDIPVTIADMADFNLSDKFDFAYLVFNTLLNLQSQEAQVKCFELVSQHLNPKGAFLVETIVPNLSLFEDFQYVKTDEVNFDGLQIEAAKHDPVTQVVECQRVQISQHGTKIKPFVFRYAWPQEIDLMAQLAGMRLEQRWGDWGGGAFSARSHMHISLYRKL